jgi:hypothetical protein
MKEFYISGNVIYFVPVCALEFKAIKIGHSMCFTAITAGKITL